MPSSSRPKDRPLRSGRTTGSCATAAAMAALQFLLTGNEATDISVPLPAPSKDRLSVPIARIEREGDTARATVIKDGGDDPDTTHGHAIQALVSIIQDSKNLEITLEGGEGVGRVTLPGLPVAVGQAAINPAPRQQIEAGVRETAGSFSGNVNILIEVPEGKSIAEKTMNARLGIQGGISILGTQGIVKPYSHESYKASIAEALDVAAAQGITCAVFTTGRRTERLYQEAHPDASPLSIIQAADFFAFSCKAAADKGFTSVTWALYFGKLVKQAQGLEYTHAKTHPVDFDLLAEHCARAGVPTALLPEIRDANTARQVLAMIEDQATRERLITSLSDLACMHARKFSGKDIATSCVVYDFDER